MVLFFIKILVFETVFKIIFQIKFNEIENKKIKISFFVLYSPSNPTTVKTVLIPPQMFLEIAKYS